jgi:hypothetical protein
MVNRIPTSCMRCVVLFESGIIACVVFRFDVIVFAEGG